MIAMHRLFSLIVCSALVLLSLQSPVPTAQATLGALCIWKGTTSQYWSDSSNWDFCNGTIPQPVDQASIVAGAYTYAPYVDGDYTITRVDLEPGTHLTLATGCTLTAGAANINGRLSGPGTLHAQTTFTWGSVTPVNYANDGIMDGGGKVVIGDSAHGYLSGYSEVCRMDNFTFENYGIMETLDTWDYAWFEINNAAVHNYDLWVADGTILDRNNNASFTNHAGATLQISNHTSMYTEFTNAGLVNIIDPAGGALPDATSLRICRGGTQSGEFKGSNDALLYFGVCYGGAIQPTPVTFPLGSKITAPRVIFYQPAHIHGTYGPIGSTSGSYLNSAVTFYADATLNGFGDQLTVYAPVTVWATAPLYQFNLEVSGPGSFSYGGTINVTNEFKCQYNGTLSGGGLIRVLPTGVMRLYACTLDQKQAENQGTIWWTNYTVTGRNNAILTNKGTFNLGGGDLITGSMTLRNEGLLSKNHASSTTIATPFENTGSIEVLQGEIIFTGDVTLPPTSTNTIVGTLHVGELLNEGALTVNGAIEGDVTNTGILTITGAVTGDLVNAGALVPGRSPGVLVISGTFTQTATGVLEIELSKDGSTPVTAPVAGVDYDQLQVGGAANLAGMLRLVAGETLAVRPLEELPFLTATGGVAGAFETLQLSDMLPQQLWSLHYGAHAVALRFNTAVYLPLVLKTD